MFTCTCFAPVLRELKEANYVPTLALCQDVHKIDEFSTKIDNINHKDTVSNNSLNRNRNNSILIRI